MLLNPMAHKCEICGLPRANGNHRKCSRILQRRYNPELNKRINDGIRVDDLKVSLQRDLSVRIRGRTKE